RLSKKDLAFLQHFGIVHPQWRWGEECLTNASGATIPNNLDNEEAFNHFCKHALGDKLMHGIYLHGGFYVGSNNLYQQLANLTGEDYHGINMCPVHFINALYGQESLKRKQRLHARFVNSALKASLLGDVVSDGL